MVTNVVVNTRRKTQVQCAKKAIKSNAILETKIEINKLKKTDTGKYYYKFLNNINSKKHFKISLY